MVTSLANQLDAVAVSSDGDFFLHDAKRGVIDVQSFCTSVMKNHKHCKIYHRQNLAEDLKVRDDLTPLLALVLGNDYTVDNYCNKLRRIMGIESTDNFKEISTKLADYLVNATGNIDEILISICDGDEDMSDQLRKELGEFDHNNESVTAQSSQYLEFDESGRKHPSVGEIVGKRSTLEEFIDALVKAGFLSAEVFDLGKHSVHSSSLQLEEIEKESTAASSKDIRKWFYHLVLQTGSIVKETSRVGRKFETREIEITTELPPLFDLLQKPLEEKQIFLMELMNIPHNKQSFIFSLIHTPSALFLMALRYFVQKINLSHEEIRAFLAMHIRLEKRLLQYVIPSEPDQNLLHIFNSFHSVFYYTSARRTRVGSYVLQSCVGGEPRRAMMVVRLCWECCNGDNGNGTSPGRPCGSSVRSGGDEWLIFAVNPSSGSGKMMSSCWGAMEQILVWWGSHSKCNKILVW